MNNFYLPQTSEILKNRIGLCLIFILSILTGGLCQGWEVKPPTSLSEINLDQFPYQSVGIIWSEASGSGSGSVVYDQSLLLTAAHVVTDNYGLVVDKLKWKRKHNDRTLPDLSEGQSIRGVWIFRGESYSSYEFVISQEQGRDKRKGTAEKFSRDIAVCIAPQTEGGYTLPFGSTTLPSRLNGDGSPPYATREGIRKRIVGYPAHNQLRYMYETSTSAENSHSDVFNQYLTPQPAGLDFAIVKNSRDMFVSGGISGGPLLLSVGSEEFVVGVCVSKSAPNDQTFGWPGVRMLTQEVIDDLLEPAKLAAHARISIDASVSWPVGQQGSYQIQVAPAGSFDPTSGNLEYYIEMEDRSAIPPSWLQLQGPDASGRITGTPTQSGSASFWVIARNKERDVNSHYREADWKPSVRNKDYGCSVYKKVTISSGQVAPCGTHAVATYRFNNKDCVVSAGIRLPFGYSFATLYPYPMRFSAGFECGSDTEVDEYVDSNTGTVTKTREISFGDVGGTLPVRVTTQARFPVKWDPTDIIPNGVNYVFSPRISVNVIEKDGDPLVLYGNDSHVNVLKGQAKDFLELIYEGSDLDSIEIIGPDKLRIPSINDIIYWAMYPRTPHPAEGRFAVRLVYEDGTSRMGSDELMIMGNGKFTVSSSANGTYISNPTITGGMFTVSHGFYEGDLTAPEELVIQVIYDDRERQRTVTKSIQLVPSNSVNLPGSVAALSTDYEVMSSQGGSVTVNVSGGGGKAWTAVSPLPWITILSGGSGTDDGDVILEVEPNGTGDFRSGEVTIGDQVIRVDQGFIFTGPLLEVPAISVPATGGEYSVYVFAAASVNWSGVPNSGWLEVISGTGIGGGQLAFAVTQNKGGARTGTITVGGETLTVSQAEASPSPSSTYGDWASESGLTGAEALPGAIPFKDGVPNLLKYAFNLNAAAPDFRTLAAPLDSNAGLPLVTTSESGQSPTLAIEFLRRKGNAGITYQPQFSSKMLPTGTGSWESATNAETLIPIDEIWERVRIKDHAPPGRACRFARIRIEEN